MYGKDIFKPLALPYCFATQARQEDVPMVHIQEISGLLGEAITSTMVALALVWWKLQHAATELGENLTKDTVLAVDELDGPILTCLGHALRLIASSFNSLSEKRRKEEVLKSWGIKRELVDMLNREYPPCLGSLFKGNVESTVSNFWLEAVLSLAELGKSSRLQSCLPSQLQQGKPQGEHS